MLKIRQTPWGKPDYVQEVYPGIYSIGTPSHGGYKLDRKRNAMMPSILRNPGGWYEEDCEWAKVVIRFPEMIPDNDVIDKEKILTSANNTFKNWFWRAYETITGNILKEGESISKDDEIFRRAK